MNILHKKLIYIFVCLFFAGSIASCVDDFDPNLGELDGSVRDINVLVNFEPNQDASLQSRSADGNSIQDISSLRMLIYDESGTNLIYDYLVWENGKKAGLNPDAISSESYSPYVADEDGMKDNATAMLSYNLKLKTGDYYIYAVANAEKELAGSDYSTVEKLKAVNCVWNLDNVKDNSQMFGIFSLTSDQTAYKDDKPVRVSNTTTTLHSWVRRLASKITVAFDGSELYDNVQIFIESVSIHDIAKQCALGVPNVAGIDPGEAANYDYRNLTDETKQPKMLAADKRYAVENGVIAIGDIDEIQKVDTSRPVVPDEYYHICNKSHPYMGMETGNGNSSDESILEHSHAQKAKAFFFYENLQGVSAEGRSKYQDGDGDGKIDNPDPEENDLNSGWKDGKAYGTYVEVIGYYRCTEADEHVNSGPIRYRFMLGKDVEKDFNVERNHHYQLTLKFKGYGNEADWHIVYEHERNIEVQSPMYISYLFNKKSMASMRISGKLPEGAKLRAEIVECDWRPWGLVGSTAFPPVPQEAYSPVSWTEKDGPWNSFLSLRMTKVVKIEIPGKEGMPSNQYDWEESWNYNKTYYVTEHKGWRTYDLMLPKGENGKDEGSTSYDSQDSKGQSEGLYFVSKLAEDAAGNTVERLVTIPLFTRAKELITRIGFTGNNPYTAYPRNAIVKLQIVQSDGVTPVDGFKPQTMQVIQVRRVVNPKGVWRRSGSTEPFRVTLMRLLDEESDFVEFKSEGKWYAEVFQGNTSGTISLSSTEKGSGVGNRPQSFVNRIEGESEHPIDFMINFHGVDGSAIVRVRYHNGTCEHDIFCREGYDPIDVSGANNCLWPSYNVAYFNGKTPVYTKSPLQQGSYFRLQNYTAICANNDGSPDGKGALGFNKRPYSTMFDVIESDKNGAVSKKQWGSITPSASVVNAQGFSEWEISSSQSHIPATHPDYQEHVATGTDFYEFISADANDVDFPISKGYGVLYGDGARETQSSLSQAYGYDRTDGADDPRGMRGVFVYNINTAAQIFFPIGITGYGHRQSWNMGGSGADVDGTLRYAGRYKIMATTGDLLDKRPMFYDLYRRPGAVYWMAHFYPSMPSLPGTKFIDVKKSSAFDMNYFSMSFEGYGGNDAVPGNNPANSHGCLMRTVLSKKK